MCRQETENNYCEIIGVVDSEKSFSHEVYGENFYCFKIKADRLSKSQDTIIVTISEKLMKDGIDIVPGERLRITGQYRSYNNFSGVGNKLVLTVFVKDIERPGDEPCVSKNEIFLDGYICKEPIYRVTPFGREITDILIAVNRVHNKSDYIPCIAWGRNAKYMSGLKVGDRIKLSGRIQSREYQKKTDDGDAETKTAYEVSINMVELKNEGA